MGFQINNRTLVQNFIEIGTNSGLETVAFKFLQYSSPRLELESNFDKKNEDNPKKIKELDDHRNGNAMYSRILYGQRGASLGDSSRDLNKKSDLLRSVPTILILLVEGFPKHFGYNYHLFISGLWGHHVMDLKSEK